MGRARALAFAAGGVAALLACDLGEIDLAGKACPCAAGWACDPASERCVRRSDAGSGDGGAIDAPAADVPSADAPVPDARVDAGTDAGLEVPSLVAWYTMDSLARGIVTDATGAGHDATCEPDACPVAAVGRIGGALVFDGVDDVLTIADHADFHVGALTIAAWINLAGGAAGYRAVVSKPYGLARDNSYMLFLSTSSQPYFELVSSTLVASESAPTDVWVHLAATWDGSVQQLYLNGTPIGTGSGTTMYDSHGLRIGGDLDDGVAVLHMQGAIDDVRIYDVALTPEEVMALASPP
jgi:hypothetical protein